MAAPLIIQKLTGAWEIPPGFRPTWYWKGTTTVTTRAGREAEFPNLVLCRLPKDEREALAARDPRWIPAIRMPVEVKLLGLEYYAGDLTPAQREIFAEAMPLYQERLRGARKPVKRVSAAEPSRRKSAPKAGTKWAAFKTAVASRKASATKARKAKK